MEQAFTRASTAISQAQRIEDFHRADIEVFLSAKVHEFLDDFDTVKSYSLNRVNPTAGRSAGESVQEGMDELMDGFEVLSHFAGAIRSGEVHSWG